MVYLIWGLVGMGVVVGIALGATLGIRMDLGKMSDGTRTRITLFCALKR